jgi:rRNA processing protein Krr1/Pno1
LGKKTQKIFLFLKKQKKKAKNKEKEKKWWKSCNNRGKQKN